MDPNWRHIIPPRHEKVISEGHCNEDCTRKAFPATGIAIFAVLMQTHSIGKEIRLRLVSVCLFVVVALYGTITPMNEPPFRSVKTKSSYRLPSMRPFIPATRNIDALSRPFVCCPATIWWPNASTTVRCATQSHWAASRDAARRAT